MMRREFILALGGAAARAQQPAMPVIGFMSARSPEDSAHLVAVVRFRPWAPLAMVRGSSISAPEFEKRLGHQITNVPRAADHPASTALPRVASGLLPVMCRGRSPLRAPLLPRSLS